MLLSATICCWLGLAAIFQLADLQPQTIHIFTMASAKFLETIIVLFLGNFVPLFEQENERDDVRDHKRNCNPCFYSMHTHLLIGESIAEETGMSIRLR